MSSWFWPFGGLYLDVQHNWHNSFLSWRIWELQLQAAERELPDLSQKVLLGEIKSNLVMMSERKSTLSHQWAISERVSWLNWHLSAGGALLKTRLRKVLCRTLFNQCLVPVNLTMVWTWLLQVLCNVHLLWDGAKEDPASVRCMPQLSEVMKRTVLKLPAPNTLVKRGTVDEFQTPRLG